MSCMFEKDEKTFAWHIYDNKLIMLFKKDERTFLWHTYDNNMNVL